MLLTTKYRCQKSVELNINPEIVSKLEFMAQYPDMPHIILSGPKGSNQEALANHFLEKLFGPAVNTLNKVPYQIPASSKKKVEIFQSMYHIIIEPTNTNHDKHVLQEVIKKYTRHRLFLTKAKFRVVLIRDVENISPNSQSALRRTMESHAADCRFIMICNNLSKLSEPLRSRCQIFTVGMPTYSQIGTIITSIAINEKINITMKKIMDISSQSNRNIKKAIWLLEYHRLGGHNIKSVSDSVKEVVGLIIKLTNDPGIARKFCTIIRTKVYAILIRNIEGTEIISQITQGIIYQIEEDVIRSKIIQHAADAERGLSLGRRDIIQIDYFIIGIMRILRYHHLGYFRYHEI